VGRSRDLAPNCSNSGWPGARSFQGGWTEWHEVSPARTDRPGVFRPFSSKPRWLISGIWWATERRPPRARAAGGCALRAPTSATPDPRPRPRVAGVGAGGAGAAPGGIHLPPPPLDRHEPNLVLSVTGPAPAGTSLCGTGPRPRFKTQRSRRWSRDSHSGRIPRGKPKRRSASRRQAGVRPRRRAVARVEPSGATAQEIRGPQELAALLAGSPSALSYVENASPNANPTSGRSSIRMRCSTRG
jgi:hypothetical protein